MMLANSKTEERTSTLARISAKFTLVGTTIAQPPFKVLQECSLEVIPVLSCYLIHLGHNMQRKINWYLFQICARFAQFAPICARFARFCGTFRIGFLPHPRSI